MTEQELFEQYAAIALEKQSDFGEVVGTRDWNIDVPQGTITFGQELTCEMQILGSFAHAPATWLWSWANEQSNLPDNVLTHAKTLREFGEENEVDLFRVPEFDFTSEELHLIGTIASGMLQASGYYLADYGKGTLLITVKSPEIDSKREDTKLRVITTFTETLQCFELHHQNAFQHYLREKGFEIAVNAGEIIGTKGAETVVGRFDAAGRLLELKG